MSELVNAINDNLNKMNRLSKKVFIYSLIFCVITFLGAVATFIFARVYWDYYNFLNLTSEKLLEIFQLSSGTMIISILIEIFLVAKEKQQ
ncbi:MAG: hypothetical protein RR911_00275 [Oscillospiraceae bacterium]